MDTKRNQTLSKRALSEQNKADKRAPENVTASHRRPLRSYQHQ